MIIQDELLINTLTLLGYNSQFRIYTIAQNGIKNFSAKRKKIYLLLFNINLHKMNAIYF